MNFRGKLLKKIAKTDWFKFFVYLSLIFLCWNLYKKDYLIIPKIYSPLKLIVSFFCLFLGFIFMSENWRAVLKQGNIVKISTRDGIVSNGLSIFYKYIPGKIMTIFGRAFYIEKKYKKPIKDLTLASLKTQLISMWVGLCIGMIVFFKINLDLWVKISALCFLVVFSLFLFSNRFRKALSYFVTRFFGKNISYPLLNIKDSLKLFPTFFLNWILWSFGYYLLCASITDYDMPLLVGFSFALSTPLAILALIAPGGIGIREAILMSSLIAFGISKQDSITISIASRLWFLIGEIFIFLLAMVLNRFTDVESNDVVSN